MVLDMDITDIPMLTTERGLLTPSPRLKLILTSSTVDITDLVMPAMVFIILPWAQHRQISFHNKHSHHRQDNEDHSWHNQVRDIHRRGGKDQLQPWARRQQTSFRSKHRDIR